MIEVAEALDLVLKSVRKPLTDTVCLEESIGRTLAEEIFADRPLPPFDRVTMDGIAINYASLEGSAKIFEIESVGAAGAPQLTLVDQNKCIEIMTGASLPKGTDTVIRYEDLSRIGNSFRINEEVREGQNVHEKGSDHAKESILLQKGTVIKAVDINILATVGKVQVEVIRLPKVAMISSGDELVDVHETPEDYQIRKSNVHMISARLKELGIEAMRFHFKDDRKGILDEVRRILDDFDVLLMSGGVSKGKFDFIPGVLEQLGFEKLFHKVAQRPGKPFWFGTMGEKTVFAFPGNPVSTLACFHKYFLPWLNKAMGRDSRKLRVVLKEDVSFRPNLTYFAQASAVQGEDGRFYARVSHGNGSGDIVNPSSMNGFLELPKGSELFKAGELHDFMPFCPLYL